MLQQLTLSLGVAIGALMLNLTLHWRGGASLQAEDFWPAFLGIAALSLTSIFAFIPLSGNAGAEMSGHKDKAGEAARQDPS